MGQNNHEILNQLRDKSDGTGADGVNNPDLQAKSDTTQLKKRIKTDADSVTINQLKGKQDYEMKPLLTRLEARKDSLQKARKSTDLK